MPARDPTRKEQLAAAVIALSLASVLIVPQTLSLWQTVWGVGVAAGLFWIVICLLILGYRAARTVHF